MNARADRERATEFLRVASMFQLGELPTEQPHPDTRGLSRWARTDPGHAVMVLKDVDLRALEMLAQPKQGRGRGAAAKPLKVIGEHPADKEPINLHDGQYGPYVKHGKVSASVPKGRDPMTVTLEEAVELIAAKAGAPKRTKRRATKGRAR